MSKTLKCKKTYSNLNKVIIVISYLYSYLIILYFHNSKYDAHRTQQWNSGILWKSDQFSILQFLYSTSIPLVAEQALYFIKLFSESWTMQLIIQLMEKIKFLTNFEDIVN